MVKILVSISVPIVHHVTPRESQLAESSKEGDTSEEEANSEGSPKHPHTPEEADPSTYHP